MDLLEKLCKTAATPGREHRLRELILEETDGLFDETEVDALGSLTGIRRPHPADGGDAPEKPTRVMIAAHMDQIGFMVSHVDEKSGFIRVQNVGGFDTRNLFARLATICPDVNDPSQDIPAVMNPGGKPIHIASDEDRKKIPEISDLVLDTGLDGETVAEKVKVGDMVVLDAPFAEVGNTVVSQCLDNRIACWIAIRTMQQLADTGHDCEVHCVFTVQEEVGLRGAGTAAYKIKPDIGIAVDTTLCVDTPGVPDQQQVTQQGKGAALTVMDSSAIADLGVFETFEAIAKDRDIPHQRSILSRGGTDAGTMQRAGAGARTFTLSCPTRYIHTVTEMVHRDDLNACRDLLAAYLAELD
ncbi:MAG: M20/M25/M40 family metallo-hydrolase [Phycisphaeraceae bacterium]|nr:M20/M25/M40 family metallo-hydrolase [Phycisphaeraceae bacterium]